MRLPVKLHAITLLLTHVTHTKNSFYLNETKRGDPRVLADVIFGAEEPQVFDVRHGVSSLYATKTHTATEKSRDVVRYQCCIYLKGQKIIDIYTNYAINTCASNDVCDGDHACN